jgi:hypothetical protein
VARYARHFHDVEAAFEKAAGGFVPQIVKAQVLDAGPTHGTGEGAFDSFSGETWKHLTRDYCAAVSEGL